MEEYTGVCKKCKRIFAAYAPTNYCPTCNAEIEKKFLEVKEYIRENPSADIETVSKETDTTEKQLMEWVKEERLQFADPALTGLTCRKCGARIMTGTYCRNCKREITKALKAEFEREINPHEEYVGASGKNRKRYITYE
jgi:uncharacterized OB-fold protein